MENLKDTVDLMLSDDYKERFLAEYYQLEIRYTKLCEIFEKWKNDRLDFELKSYPYMLEKQIEGMKMYLDVLKDRAGVENIDI